MSSDKIGILLELLNNEGNWPIVSFTAIDKVNPIDYLLLSSPNNDCGWLFIGGH